MKTYQAFVSSLALLVAGTVAGCSGTSAKSPDVTDAIRSSLDQSGLKDVSIAEDRDKGVVTLGGHVDGDGDKLRAETVAKSFAGNQVVADQIAVVPPGGEKDAKAMNSDLDGGIEKNLDASMTILEPMWRQMRHNVSIVNKSKSFGCNKPLEILRKNIIADFRFSKSV